LGRFAARADWGKNPIQPEGERVVSFDLPQPNEAGTFVGQLYITANQQKTVAVPFTVRSRGPWGTTIIPFALFCLVLGIGFWVSGVRDNWFSGGGLARAQAYLSLRNSQAALVQRYAVLQDWKSHLPPPPPTIGLPKTEHPHQEPVECVISMQLHSSENARLEVNQADASVEDRIQ
jgi:hypothetical protein